MGEDGRRRRIEPTDEWERIELLCGWPEQRDYELIRPLVLFGGSAGERSQDTGAASGRTLQRRAKRFEAEGMESLFGSERAGRKRLPPAMRRLVVDLKAEYPGLNPNQIANACYVRFGRRPARKTVKRVLEEEPTPLRFVRRFPPYHEVPEPAERRRAFLSSRFARTLDSLGYARFRHWRLYGEEALAGREAALWLAAESLTLEHAGEPLSRYEVRVEAQTGELRSVGRPRLFETARAAAQQRLFGLEALGETGWLKALKLEGYAPRRPRGPLTLQQVLFPYAEAL